MVHQELIEISSKGEYLAECRITRDELARVIDCGAANLLVLRGKRLPKSFRLLAHMSKEAKLKYFKGPMTGSSEMTH